MANIFRDDLGMKLTNAIDRATVGSDRPALTGTHRSAGMSPSSASAVVTDPITGMKETIGTCVRKVWYQLKGYPEEGRPLEARHARIMQAGNILAETFIYDKAKEAGIWAGDEIKFFDPDNLLSGRLDLMVYVPGTTQLMVVECKTVGPWADIPYIKAGRRGFNHLEPRFKDIPQLMSYMQWWLQFGVKYGALYYLSRDMASSEYNFEWVGVPEGAKRPPDSAYLRCHSSERTWDMPWLTWGMIRGRYALLRKCLRDNVVPPRDYHLQYSNRHLMQMTKYVNKGSQILGITKTDSDKIQAKFRSECARKGTSDPESHDVYLEKGDIECSYCPYQKICWTGLGGPTVPELSPDSFETEKTPRPPVVEKSSTPASIRPKENLL